MNSKIIGKAGTFSPLARVADVMRVAAWACTIVGLAGLLTVGAAQPAAAAQSRNSQFMVSVQVIHDCQYQIKSQARNPSVVSVLMQGCESKPRITTRGFVTSDTRALAGHDAVGYQLRETSRASTARTRYIEIDF